MPGLDFAPPAVTPKIASAVPLSAAPADKQELYAPLTGEAPEAAAVEDSESQLEKPADPNSPDPLPSVEDKEAFLASVLGKTPYTKEYTIFDGTVKVCLSDCTPEESDSLYSQLADMRDKREINSAEDWNLWAARLRLAVQLRKLSLDSKAEEFDRISGDRLVARARILMRMPRSIFYALLDLSAHMEKSVLYLISHMRDPGFYRAGG